MYTYAIRGHIRKRDTIRKTNLVGDAPVLRFFFRVCHRFLRFQQAFATERPSTAPVVVAFENMPFRRSDKTVVYCVRGPFERRLEKLHTGKVRKTRGHRGQPRDRFDQGGEARVRGELHR